MGGSVIRVMVVEDSASARDLLTRVLQSDPGFVVIGTATDGEEAVALAARLRPDVITMDIRMPRLDGVAATRRIMATMPVPIVIVSASVEEKAVGRAFEALQAGALAVVDKPPGPGQPGHAAAAAELVTTVRLMAEVKVVRRWAGNGARSPVGQDAAAAPVTRGEAGPLAIAVAASTGGPQAVQTVLQGLGGELGVPVFVVQHMADGFIGGMATWLSATCPQPVRLAVQGEEAAAGVVHLAPEGHHLVVTRRRTLTLSKAPPVRGFRPSANVLFESVAECYGARAVGLILTGMGDDGAAGLAALRAAGAATIAQDESTSVVYGMPAAAVVTGAAGQVLPLAEIGPRVRRLVG